MDKNMTPKYLFNHLNELVEFKDDNNTAILTDIDGTISEIASSPEKAVVSSIMRNALIKLKDKFKLVAVISGRSVLNAREMVGVEGLLYVGNHGLEYLKNGERVMVPGVESFLDQMKALGIEFKEGELPNIKGLKLEDKGICLSIHYRECEDPEAIREKILETFGRSIYAKNITVSEGRKIVEFKPPLGFDKGSILENIIKEHTLERVIYLGDDITDLDAFNSLGKLQNEEKIMGVSVLIQSSEIPDYVKEGSSFFVEDVDDVLRFFEWLID